MYIIRHDQLSSSIAIAYIGAEKTRNNSFHAKVKNGREPVWEKKMFPYLAGILLANNNNSIAQG